MGSRFEGLKPGSHLGLPSPSLTLIVGIDSAIDVAAMPDSGQAPGSFPALVGGLHNSSATIGYGTSLSCVNVQPPAGVPRGVVGDSGGRLRLPGPSPPDP